MNIPKYIKENEELYGNSMGWRIMPYHEFVVKYNNQVIMIRAKAWGEADYSVVFNFEARHEEFDEESKAKAFLDGLMKGYNLGYKKGYDKKDSHARCMG